MKKYLRLGIVMTLVISISGCATILREDYDRVQFRSTPPAKVEVEGYGACNETPCSISVPRDMMATRAVFKNSQCKEHTEPMGTEMNPPWLIVSILAGGIIGFAIDMISGNVNDVKPNPVNVNLKC